MKILGLEFGRAARAAEQKKLQSVSENAGGWFRILESFTGAWQTSVAVDHNAALSFFAVNACMTLQAADLAKMRVKLIGQDSAGIWTETKDKRFSPVLRRPNRMQNRIQFWENYLLSKLSRGNVYALKERGGGGRVTALYILDPLRVTPLVSESGDVFYRLQTDNLAGLGAEVTVPAREIIHDRMNCLFHPLVGVSPIFAAGVAATQGLAIQNNSAYFFDNKSQPGGILTAPGAIGDETAARLKAYWEANFSGEKSGRVAVVGDGLKYEPLAFSAKDSQLIEQSKWSAEVVCSVFHVPPYKIGLGALPSYNNVQALNVEYYSQGLQIHIESAELALTEGLEMPENLGAEFDLEGLLRMDAATQMDVLEKGVKAGVLAPNEGRRRVNLRAVPGGESPYLQQQNFSLAALARRDAKEDPFAAADAPAAIGDEETDETAGDDDEAEARGLAALTRGEKIWNRKAAAL